MKLNRTAALLSSAITLLSLTGWARADSPDATTEVPQKVYITGSSVKHIQGETSLDRKSTRLNSSHITRSRMPSSA